MKKNKGSKTWIIITIIIILQVTIISLFIYNIHRDSTEEVALDTFETKNNIEKNVTVNIPANVQKNNLEKECIFLDNKKKDNETSNTSKQTEIKNENKDNVQIENDKVSFAETNETVYAIDTVNVRDGDSIHAKKIGLLNYGDSVNRIGIGSNGWSKVNYNKKVAYVSSEYLSKEKPKPIEHNDIEITVDPNRKIDPNKPMVALTFDDGPNPIATPRILDTLEKYKVVATFFDLGTCMRTYPNITKREKTIGCEIGSHTYSHKNLNNLSEKEIQDDINAAASIYENTLGEKLKLVRTPYGNANNKVKATLNYALINWDIDTLDWKSRNADSILKEIRNYKSLDGRIILMHSIYNSTADAVETLVPELINKGYQLVTVSELAKYKGYTLQTGTIYYNFK